MVRKDDIEAWVKYILAPKVLKSKYDKVAINLSACHKGYCKTITAQHSEIEKLKVKVKELDLLLEAKKLNDSKHESLESYENFLETIPPTLKTYDFGHGRRAVHTIFKSSIQDEVEIRDFIINMLGFDGSEYATADELMYSFCIKMSSKYPTKKYYASDTVLYGMIEYWARAKETIQRILDKEPKLFDCDDMMTLKFSCLYYLLRDFFPEDAWRLRGFVVDLWGAGGHAMLGWVKEGVNDFVPIETTYKDIDQRFIWNKNYVIRNQLFYQIRYSFDEKMEYVKI